MRCSPKPTDCTAGRGIGRIYQGGRGSCYVKVRVLDRLSCHFLPHVVGCLLRKKAYKRGGGGGGHRHPRTPPAMPLIAGKASGGAHRVTDRERETTYVIAAGQGIQNALSSGMDTPGHKCLDTDRVDWRSFVSGLCLNTEYTGFRSNHGPCTCSKNKP